MPTDAINTGFDRSVIYPKLLTRVGDSSGPPTGDTYATDFTAIRVVQSAGGQTFDYADHDFQVTSPLVNRDQPAFFQKMVDVLVPTGADPPPRIHLGDYVTETEVVNPTTEALTGQSQIRSYHFGTIFLGQLWVDADDNDVESHLPPVFNPTIDGKTLANRSDTKRSPEDAYYWIHPEAALTQAAETVSGQTAEEWDLVEAVLAMCWICNESELTIKNPTRSHLATVIGTVALEDVRLPAGKHLSYYLDRLLQPLGFNWFIDYSQTVEGENTVHDKPRILVFQKGVGTHKTLKMQAPNVALNLGASNTNDYRISRRIGDSVNVIYVFGGYREAEVTLPLWKTWPAADDSLSASQLTKSDPASDYEDNPYVWRLWAANEGGDYTGVRTEIGDPPDLSDVFPTGYVPHRRSIGNPLTLDGETNNPQRRQIHLEYSTDDGSTWQIVPPSFGQPFVMPGQIAILFTGDTPPAELIEAGDDAKLRITGVVQGDRRVTGIAGKSSFAVNARDVPLYIDQPDKFREQFVYEATGDPLPDPNYSSVLAGDPAGADERDDSVAAQDYADELRDQYGTAELDCTFKLPGIHLTYEIGDLITKIEGREVALDGAATDDPSPQYVQIVKREWVYQPGPVTILTVDRGTRAVSQSGGRV